MRAPMVQYSVVLGLLVLVLAAMPAAAFERLAVITDQVDQNPFFVQSKGDVNGDGRTDILLTGYVDTGGLPWPTSNEACIRVYSGTGTLIWEYVMGHSVIFELCPDCAWNNPLAIDYVRFGDADPTPGTEALIRWRGETAAPIPSRGWVLVSTTTNAILAKFSGDGYWTSSAYLVNATANNYDEIVFVRTDSTQVWGFPDPSSVETGRGTSPELSMRGSPSACPSASFTVPAPGMVTADVYSVEGRAVRSLHNGPMLAGRQMLRWDGLDDAGRPAAAGMYFIRVTTTDGAQSEKAVLIR